MFNEFNRVSKIEWLAKVEKDLKGKKPIENFNWELDGMTFTPFHHRDDSIVGAPLIHNQASNSWEIGERIIVDNYKNANQQALSALQKGANALLFVLNETPSFDELTILLKDIQLEWISTHFNLGATDLIDNFIKIAKNNNQDLAKIVCSFALENMSQLAHYSAQLPKASFLNIQAINPSDSLATIIDKGNKILEKINEIGLDLSKYYNQIQFSITITDHYFPSIAKIRALKILWEQILTAWNITDQSNCNINTHIITNTDNENSNKIKATTQAMSAVIAGVNRLYIYPSDSFKHENGTSFSRRIALNVQHLLQQESYLDRVIDPSAGSYFIENLTNAIAEKAWAEFVISD